MALVRWEPARELNALQQEVNRLFGTFFDAPGRAPGNGGLTRWVPSMDLVETGDHFVLRADLPGLNESDVNIELEENVLTISGERKLDHEEREEGFYRLERAYGQFSRSLTLPKGIDGDSITADFKDGVLEMRIPKPAETKPRRVKIGAGAGGGGQEAIEGNSSESNGN